MSATSCDSKRAQSEPARSSPPKFTNDRNSHVTPRLPKSSDVVTTARSDRTGKAVGSARFSMGCDDLPDGVAEQQRARQGRRVARDHDSQRDHRSRLRRRSGGRQTISPVTRTMPCLPLWPSGRTPSSPRLPRSGTSCSGPASVSSPDDDGALPRRRCLERDTADPARDLEISVANVSKRTTRAKRKAA